MLVDLSPRELFILQSGQYALAIVLQQDLPHNSLTPDAQQECLELATKMKKLHAEAVSGIHV